MSRDERIFWRTLSALRAECPTAMAVPIRVRRTGRDRVDGGGFGRSAASRDGRHLNVIVRTWVRVDGRLRRATTEEVRDTLIHEWAHCMTWTPEGHPNLTDHDASFGVAYSRAYAAVVED